MLLGSTIASMKRGLAHKSLKELHKHKLIYHDAKKCVLEDLACARECVRDHD